MSADIDFSVIENFFSNPEFIPDEIPEEPLGFQTETQLKPIIIEEGTSDDVFVRKADNGTIYTTSLDIAKKFNNGHKNVMNIIDRMIKTNPEAKYMFYPAYFTVSNGNTYPMYCCNKSGFILTVMRFRGKIAEKAKLECIERYINVFNDLEANLKITYSELLKRQSGNAGTVMPPRKSKEFLAMALIDAQAIIDEQDGIIKQQIQQIEEMKPAQDFKDAFSETENCMLVRDFSKALSQRLQGADLIDKRYLKEIGEKRLFAWFRANGYLIKNGDGKNTPTQKSAEQELFRLVAITSSVNGSKPCVHKYAKLTAKGVDYFMNKIVNIYKEGGTILV